VVGVRLEIRLKKKWTQVGVAKINRRKAPPEHLSQWFIGASVLENMARRGWKIFTGRSASTISLNHPCPDHGVPTPSWPSILVREWSPFAYKRIYLGRTKTGFYAAQTGLQGSDY